MEAAGRRGVGSGSFQTPPRSFREMMKRETVTSNQVVALVRAQLHGAIQRSKVVRVITDLVRRGDLRPTIRQEEAYEPDDVDRIVGELWRMSIPWYQRRNVAGDEWAWVECPEWEGRRLLRIPLERRWVVKLDREVTRSATRLACFEWPTGRWTGDLVLTGVEHGYPVYQWRERKGAERTHARERILAGQHAPEAALRLKA